MSYHSQALLSRDPDFVSRIAACAAVEIPQAYGQPTTWAEQRIWWLAAAPGFADQYEYALNTSVENPGADPGVITDGQILAAVQAQYNSEVATPLAGPIE